MPLQSRETSPHPFGPAVSRLIEQFAMLPGIGQKSAERLAHHILRCSQQEAEDLANAIRQVKTAVRRCSICFNLTESDVCTICRNPQRNKNVVCVVEHVPDLVAMERSGAYRGGYHVLHGRLSPINGVGPDDINWPALRERLESGEVRELILALGNDVEGEATCHFITRHLQAGAETPAIKVSRIGFGLPSGGGVLYADAVTLRSALEGRREYS